jgi:hypothetical protein
VIPCFLRPVGAGLLIRRQPRVSFAFGELHPWLQSSAPLGRYALPPKVSRTPFVNTGPAHGGPDAGAAAFGSE